jgi:hypothetical protein
MVEKGSKILIKAPNKRRLCGYELRHAVVKDITPCGRFIKVRLCFGNKLLWISEKDIHDPS